MNPGFQELDVLIRTGDGRNIVLMEPITFVSKKGEVFTIPSFFQSDGASSPQFLWNIFPPFGKYWKPALFHDFLYRETNIPKTICDYLFLEAMLFMGVPRKEAVKIYLGVKHGGWKAFKEDRELLKKRKENENSSSGSSSVS